VAPTAGNAPPRRLGGNVYGFASPPLTWSPDGMEVAFRNELSQPIEGSFQWITAASRDGGVIRRVVPGDQPAWSSSGWIAFAHANPDYQELKLVRPDGSDLRSIADLGPNSDQPTHLDWAPDATKLAISMRWGSLGTCRDFSICILDFAGEEAHPLVRGRLGRSDGASASWSPNGRRLAFIFGGDIYAVRAAGGHPRKFVESRRLFRRRAHQLTRVHALDWAP
jgi:Tol biopolymer transport system component